MCVFLCLQCAASCRLHMASANYFCIIYSGSLTHTHTHASTPAHTCLHYCYNILFRTSPLRLLLPPLGRSACSHLVQFPTTFGRLKFNSPSRLQKQFACATVCACVCVCVQLILMANLTLIAKCLTRAALQLNETATFEGAR